MILILIILLSQQPIQNTTVSQVSQPVVNEYYFETEIEPRIQEDMQIIQQEKEERKAEEAAMDVEKTVSIPNYPGFKSYMTYNSFLRSSEQYAMQQLAYTDETTGLRKYEDRYIIAVGSGVTTTIGQYLDLVLENGTVIPCVVGDQKADRDTDSSNLFSNTSNCCSEFTCSLAGLRKDVKSCGNVSLMYDGWNSPVAQIIVYDKNALSAN